MQPTHEYLRTISTERHTAIYGGPMYPYEKPLYLQGGFAEPRTEDQSTIETFCWAVNGTVNTAYDEFPLNAGERWTKLSDMLDKIERAMCFDEQATLALNDARDGVRQSNETGDHAVTQEALGNYLWVAKKAIKRRGS